MALASWVAISTAMFAAILLSLTWGNHWKEVQDNARARRIADALMNARLLRLNI